MNTPTHVSLAQRGFTLIELLTVILIVAILAGILLAGVETVRARAETVTCASNLRQLYTATQLFSQDHNGRLPALYESKPWYAVLKLEGYLEDMAVFYCPSALPQDWASAQEKGQVTASTVSYGYNFLISGGIGVAPKLSNLSISNYSTLILFGDGLDAEGSIDQYYIEKRTDDTIRAGARHGGQIQMVFVDGHVAKMRPEDLNDNKYWVPRKN